jgi:hypothetical protein
MDTTVLAALIGGAGSILAPVVGYLLVRKRKSAGAKSNKLSPAPSNIVQLLFVAADASMSLRLGGEIRGIIHGLRASKHGDAFSLEQLWATRWEDFRRELLRSTPDIVHFAGHASPEGLFFEDDSGNGALITNEQFAELLIPFSARVRLVFVNACDSSALCEAAAKVIDFVIGIPYQLDDEVAIDFSTAFYEAIADGKPVQTAFNFAAANIGSTIIDEPYRLFTGKVGPNPHVTSLICPDVSRNTTNVSGHRRSRAV